MALNPLTRSNAWIVIVNALVGGIVLAVVALVEPANRAVRDGLNDAGVPFGVAFLVATASVAFWLGFGFWSLSKAPHHQ